MDNDADGTGRTATLPEGTNGIEGSNGTGLAFEVENTGTCDVTHFPMFPGDQAGDVCVCVTQHETDGKDEYNNGELAVVCTMTFVVELRNEDG